MSAGPIIPHVTEYQPLGNGDPEEYSLSRKSSMSSLTSWRSTASQGSRKTSALCRLISGRRSRCSNCPGSGMATVVADVKAEVMDQSDARSSCSSRRLTADFHTTSELGPLSLLGIPALPSIPPPFEGCPSPIPEYTPRQLEGLEQTHSVILETPSLVATPQESVVSPPPCRQHSAPVCSRSVARHISFSGMPHTDPANQIHDAFRPIPSQGLSTGNTPPTSDAATKDVTHRNDCMDPTQEIGTHRQVSASPEGCSEVQTSSDVPPPGLEGIGGHVTSSPATLAPSSVALHISVNTEGPSTKSAAAQGVTAEEEIPTHQAGVTAAEQHGSLARLQTANPSSGAQPLAGPVTSRKDAEVAEEAGVKECDRRPSSSDRRRISAAASASPLGPSGATSSKGNHDEPAEHTQSKHHHKQEPGCCVLC